jgi:hypothetical protein
LEEVMEEDMIGEAGRGRIFDGRGGGRGRGIRPVGRANVSSTIGEASQVVNVEMTADDWEKWSQFKFN